ncbi:hypothetical protein [Streptomyces hiroshimensis]|uniref:Type II toxin-antitoxin system RelE/ParE family toxin n=1 Tax=Streptomyces hiroshimensis TaxID=66424 RepID=A0ABQ2YHY1_9ACTN|nr:hypothetical protein [Streptomyces hiroshimensis]GGX82622.1 hypothetical protein GCM10010324_30320 [Streptomyces hiroshimensis]
MGYRLKYDRAAEAVHDALPPEASERLSLALAAACDDPIAATEPYGEDDGVVRMIVTEEAIAVLLVGEITKTLTVLQLSYTG